MATKDKTSPTKKTVSTSKVTRIKAVDEKTPKKKVAAKTVAIKEQGDDTKRKNPLAAIGSYFAGAWYELRQVRWPNRKATWSLTLAVIAFTAFFIVLILLLDALYKYLFEIILG